MVRSQPCIGVVCRKAKILTGVSGDLLIPTGRIVFYDQVLNDIYHDPTSCQILPMGIALRSSSLLYGRTEFSLSAHTSTEYSKAHHVLEGTVGTKSTAHGNIATAIATARHTMDNYLLRISARLSPSAVCEGPPQISETGNGRMRPSS